MSLAAHLPAILVVTPLMAAPVCVAVRHATAAWAIVTAVAASSLAIAVSLLARVLDQGAFTYLLGGWAAPWGIEYRVDAANALVLVIVSAIATVVAVAARATVNREVEPERRYLYYTMFSLCLSGLLGQTITADAFNLFVFLEITSLSSYVLVSMGSDRRGLTAAYRYLVFGTIGATFYVIGVGLAYIMTGTLNMPDLAARLPAVAHTSTVQVSLAFLTVGLLLKMAAFPLHLWLPDAYAYAPSASSAFLAGTATKVTVYVFLRMFLGVFGATGLAMRVPVAEVLMVLALLGMLVGSAVAIWQPNVKRAFAYSSIAQIGYILLGASLMSRTGVSAAVVHLFNHALMKSGLFLGLAAVMLRVGSVRIDDLAGVGRRMPFTMAAVVVCGLSLIGVPLTVGFVSKWYLVAAAIEQGYWAVAVVILVSSLLALVYVWRIVEVAYFREPGPAASRASEAPLSVLVPTWTLAVATVVFGVHARGTMTVAGRAAHLLLGSLAP